MGEPKPRYPVEGQPSTKGARRLHNGIEIEIKRFHTPRIAEQMSRVPNVIVAQGEDAVMFLADLIARNSL